MKNIKIAICVIFLIVSVISCNKTAVQANLLVGKWNIVTDSSYSPIANIGVKNYIGTSGDYYKFTDNGTVYLNENSILDTATYSMINDNLNIVYNSGSYSPYYITNLTVNTVILTLVTPPLGPKRIINLSKK